MNRDTAAILKGNELKYIDLYRGLVGGHTADSMPLAAPFMSCPMEGYWEAPLKVMYVGKATGGKWGYDIFTFEELFFESGIELTSFLEKTKICTGNFLKRVQNKSFNSAFWRFAFNLSQKAYGIEGSTGRPLANLVWSNVAKLGVNEGNPRGDYLRSQVELARATLKAEVAHYRPDAIVVCTGIFANGEGNSPDIVHAVFGAVDHAEWQKPLDSLWWRRSSMQEFGLQDNDKPVIITITDHPQGTRREVVEKWINIIAESWRSRDFSKPEDTNKKGAHLSVEYGSEVFENKSGHRNRYRRAITNVRLLTIRFLHVSLTRLRQGVGVVRGRLPHL